MRFVLPGLCAKFAVFLRDQLRSRSETAIVDRVSWGESRHVLTTIFRKIVPLGTKCSKEAKIATGRLAEGHDTHCRMHVVFRPEYVGAKPGAASSDDAFRCRHLALASSQHHRSSHAHHSTLRAYTAFRIAQDVFRQAIIPGIAANNYSPAR